MRLVDADKLFPDVMKVDGSMAISQGQLAHAHTVEAIPKAEYENRLKADMVAMLTDIQLEIEENSYSENVYGDEYGIDQVISTDEIYQFIQQKIDALKAESEDNNGTNNYSTKY